MEADFKIDCKLSDFTQQDVTLTLVLESREILSESILNSSLMQFLDLIGDILFSDFDEDLLEDKMFQKLKPLKLEVSLTAAESSDS
eukprot:Awhi_evm1s7719